MSFAFETTVDVRYTDVDTYGHVNNAVYATLMEEARIDYLEAVLGDAARALTGTTETTESEGGEADANEADGDATDADARDASIVVASLELDFRRPIRLPDAVTVGVRVPRLGESSFPFEYEIRGDGHVAAEGETTMVAYDRAAGSSQPIPAAWRERITEFEGL